MHALLRYTFKTDLDSAFTIVVISGTLDTKEITDGRVLQTEIGGIHATELPGEVQSTGSLDVQQDLPI